MAVAMAAVRPGLPAEKVFTNIAAIVCIDFTRL
jgi:hypothetical protein